MKLSCSTGCRRAKWGGLSKSSSHVCRSFWTIARSSCRLDTKGRNWLADKGWDPAYGARPLKRVIQRYVQDPLAEMILAGDIVDGDHVALSVEGNVLTFNGKAPQTAEIAQFEAPIPKRKLN